MKKAVLASLLLLGSISATTWAQDDFYEEETSEEAPMVTPSGADETQIHEEGSESDYEDYETNFED
jgi:hypothetical protein